MTEDANAKISRQAREAISSGAPSREWVEERLREQRDAHPEWFRPDLPWQRQPVPEVK